MYLFVDSSSFIQVGLLNEKFEWESYELIENRKGSHIIHSAIYSILREKNLKIKNIKGIFLANGPGSYTGIRVAEGLCQVLELEGIKVYSFYHFEVPQMCGFERYSFISQAFKGEIFHYNLDQGSESFELMKEDDPLYLNPQEEVLFSLNGELLGQNQYKLYDCYREKTSDIFSRVYERGTHGPPYYYRTVEKEFKLPQK